MVERDRWVKAGAYSGPKSRVYKLTDDQVRAIRKETRKPWQVAFDYRIGVTTAYDIMRRRRKTLVPD